MDLRTLRNRIRSGECGSVADLMADMELMFSNCHLFHRRQSEIGRAGTSLKRFFEKRCNDLGLKDLALVSGPPSASLRPSRRKRHQ